MKEKKKYMKKYTYTDEEKKFWAAYLSVKKITSESELLNY